jgi:bacterioferritin-associated ferredoxin
MFVCICKGVREKQIRREVQRGATTFEELQMSLDVGICCGQCEETAKALIDETLDQERALDAMTHCQYQQA